VLRDKRSTTAVEGPLSPQPIDGLAGIFFESLSVVLCPCCRRENASPRLSSHQLEGILRLHKSRTSCGSSSAQDDNIPSAPALFTLVYAASFFFFFSSFLSTRMPLSTCFSSSKNGGKNLITVSWVLLKSTPSARASSTIGRAGISRFSP
jgi:hypothetical protein